jgi:hypothetical protein
MQQCILCEISSMPESLWEYLVQKNKIVCNWKNCIAYYKQRGYDGSIHQFVIDNITTLINSDSSFSDSDTKIILIKLQKAILEDEKLDYSAFETILTVIPPEQFFKNPIDIQRIEEKKMALLISKHYIILSKDTYDKIKAKFVNLHLQLLLFNPKDYESNITQYSLKNTDLSWLVQSKMPDEIKRKIIIENFNFIDNNNIAEVIGNYIIHYWAEEELPVEVVNSVNNKDIDYVLKARVILKQNIIQNVDPILLQNEIAKCEKPLCLMLITNGKQKFENKQEVYDLALLLKDKGVVERVYRDAHGNFIVSNQEP